MQPSRYHRGSAVTDNPREICRPHVTTRSPLAHGPEHFESLGAEVHQHCETVRVAPIGEFDLATGPSLRGQLQKLAESGFSSIVLDLCRLAFVDAAGLNLVLGFNQQARDRGLRFEIIQGSSNPQRLFEDTGLPDQLPFGAGTQAGHLNGARQPGGPDQRRPAVTETGGTPKGGTRRILLPAAGAAAASQITMASPPFRGDHRPARSRFPERSPDEVRGFGHSATTCPKCASHETRTEVEQTKELHTCPSC